MTSRQFYNQFYNHTSVDIPLLRGQNGVPHITAITLVKDTVIPVFITHQDYSIITVTFDQPVQLDPNKPLPVIRLNDGDISQYLHQFESNTLKFINFAGPHTHNVPELKVTGFDNAESIVSVTDPNIWANLSLTGIHTDFPAVDMDTHFTVAQAQTLEDNHQSVGSQLWPYDLTDTPKAIETLLGGHTWEDVINHIDKLEATGISRVEVQLPNNREFEFGVHELHIAATHQGELHGAESAVLQNYEINQFFDHWHI